MTKDNVIDLKKPEPFIDYPIIADTLNFIFETALNVDNCIVAPDYLEEDYF
jgi:hypothetical protein